MRLDGARRCSDMHAHMPPCNTPWGRPPPCHIPATVRAAAVRQLWDVYGASVWAIPRHLAMHRCSPAHVTHSRTRSVDTNTLAAEAAFGAIGGLIGAVLTTPADVVTTRIMTESEECARKELEHRRIGAHVPLRPPHARKQTTELGQTIGQTTAWSDHRPDHRLVWPMCRSALLALARPRPAVRSLARVWAAASRN